MSHILHRGETEPNGAAMRGEVGIGHIDVRSLDGNAHLAAFVDVLDHIIGAAGHGSQ